MSEEPPNRRKSEIYYAHFRSEVIRLTAERGQLRTELAVALADVVTLRKALERIKRGDYNNAHDCKAAARVAEHSLATDHPGAPLVEAVGKACESLKHVADTFASYVKIHANKHTPEGDAKAVANHLAHTE